MTPIATLLSFHRCGHTELQMDRFITVRAGGTPYGCFVQALRELWKRWRGVTDAAHDREELLYRIWKLEGRGDRWSAIRLKRRRRALEELEFRIECDRLELCRFYAQAAALYAHLGFDRDPPTPERLEQLDRERWEHNVLCAIALDAIDGSGLRRATAEMVQCLEPQQRARVLRRAYGPDPLRQGGTRGHVESLVQWYLNYSPDLPEPKPLTEADRADLLAGCESFALPAPLQSSFLTAAGLSADPSMPPVSRSARPALAGPA